MENTNTMIKPPVNGKKLWRVKRVASNGSKSSPVSPGENSSIECLQNSLKIAAAGNAYSTKRAPLRRPKNKPGKPKDFVFVDLSPVKQDSPLNTEDESSFSSSESSSSPSSLLTDKSHISRSFSFDDSMSTSGSDDDSVFSNIGEYSFLDSLDGDSNFLGCVQDVNKGNYSEDNYTTGLGISGLEWQSDDLFHSSFAQASPDNSVTIHNQSYTQFAAQNYQMQQLQQMQLEFLALQQQLQSMGSSFQNPQFQKTYDLLNDNPKKTPAASRPALDSPKRRSSGELQFKTYKGPGVKKSKPQLKHRHTISEPSHTRNITKNNRSAEKTKYLENFMDLNQQIEVHLSQADSPKLQDMQSISTPETKTVGSENSSNITCGMDDFLYQKLDEVDLTSLALY